MCLAGHGPELMGLLEIEYFVAKDCGLGPMGWPLASDRILCHKGHGQGLMGLLETEYSATKDHGLGPMGWLVIEYVTTKDHAWADGPARDRILCYEVRIDMVLLRWPAI